MKAKLLIYTALILLAFSACEDFLEEDPRDIIAPENYFQSESDIKAGIIGIYAIYKNNSMYGQIGLDGYYDNGVDILESSRATGLIGVWSTYNYTEESVNGVSQKMGPMQTWKDAFRIISNVNLILRSVEQNEELAQVKKDEFKGELLFLRALAYYHLTNMWGDVPYFREFTTLEEMSVATREDVHKIRNEIAADLEQAQQWMPNEIVSSENGRAPRWAAAMLAAKIYLIQKDWQKAKDKAMEIIQSNKYELLDDYSSVFDPNNEYNKEIIWSLDFAKDIQSMLEKGVPSMAGNGYWRPAMFSPRLRDEPKNSDEKLELVAKLEANGEAFNGTGLQVPIPDFEKKFPINDLRRPANIMRYYEGIELNFAYMPKIFNLNVATSPRFNHSDNKIIFRLAEAYLIVAEAENEINGPSNAYQYINEVRERAYVTQEEWELKGLDQQQFREAIYDERKWELAGESTRKIDLIRWGILSDVIQSAEYNVYDPAENFEPHNVLLPIGTDELNLNPALLETDPTNNGYR